MKKMSIKDNAGRMSTNYPLLDSYLTLTRPLHAYRSIVYFFAVFAMLLLGGWSSEAWGWNGTYTVTMKSSPAAGGYVSNSNNFSGKATEATASGSISGKKVYQTGTISVTLYAQAKSGYTFVAWAKNADGTDVQYNSSTYTRTSETLHVVNQSQNETLYAIFKPTYTIVFNGNGSTGGSMSNLSMVYGTAKALTANGFQKQPTVTYNANGGSSVSSDKITYSFNGWEDRNSIVYNKTTYAYTTFDAPYYANTYSDLYKAFGYNKYNLIQHYVNNGKGEGRSCKGATPGLYPNQASVNNLTTTAGGTVTLYANWSTTQSVTLPSSTQSGKVLEGWYSGSTKIGEPGDTYVPTANITLKANWVDKFEPVMEGANTNMMVDGEQTSAFTFNHVDGQVAHIKVTSIDAINNGDGKVIEYDAANNRIIAHNAGTATIYFTQAETSTIKEGTSATYTYTVYKYNSEFAGVSNLSDVKVEGDKSSSFTLTYTKPDNAYVGTANHTASTPVEGVSASSFYYTLGHSVTAANTTGSTDATKAIAYTASTRTVTGKNAGTGTVNLVQPETYKYNGASTSFTATVVKNTPVFTWNGGSSTYYHNKTITNVFSTSNTDFAYTIGSSTDAQVAYESGNTLYVLSKNGTAQFTVSQAENYKWNGKSQTYSVTPSNPSNHVTFTYTQAMYNDGSITTQKVSSSWDGSNQVTLEGGTTDWDDKYIVIKFKGIPDKLSFKHCASSTNVSNGWTSYMQADWYVVQSADGVNWSNVWENKGGSNSNSTSWQTISNKQLSSDTRYLKFCYSGNFAGYFKDITVTELKKFTPNSSSLDFGTLSVNEKCDDKTFDFNYANVGHNVTLSVNDEHFTVSPTKITNIGGEQAGKTTITVSYYTAEAHKSNGAKLTIKDELGNSATVNLSGETKKLEPTITWSPNEATFNVDDELTAVSANDLEVTLSVAAADKAYVHCEGNKATMIEAKAGTVTITAHVTGDKIYADKDITKEITITNLTKQHITWEQDFSRLKTTDETKSITLNATSDSGLPVTYELVGDKTGLTLTQSGDTWTLTYSAKECKNTTIVAKQGGNSEYAPAASVSIPVRVIDPTKVCDVNETLVNSTVTLKKESTTYNIDIPSTMTIQVSRTKTSWAIYTNGFEVEFYSGRNGTGNKLGSTYSYGASDINTSQTISLSNLNIDAKSVKLISNATNGYNVTSVTYTKRKSSSISPESLSFETYPNTTTLYKTFDVTYVNYPIMLECSNNKFEFSPAEFGDCSEYGTQTVSVRYTAGDNAGEDSGYLYIKDNTGTTLHTCTLSVTIKEKMSQSITTHTIGTSYKTTDKITLTAETNSGLSNFTYSASPAGVASFDGNVMTFLKSGTIAITVTEAGSNMYNPCSATEENVVVSKVVPNIASVPTGSEVTYLQTLNSSTLTTTNARAEVTLRGEANTAVAGGWNWTNPSMRVENNAGKHSYPVTFTPEDGGMYENATCSVEIQVNKAKQAIEMNNGGVKVAVTGLDENATDSKLNLNTLIVSQTTDAVEASRAGAVTYQVISENRTNATISGTTFYATATGTYTIVATKAATDYYEQATDTFTVTVTKRANTLSVTSAYTPYVDDEIKEVAKVINSDGKIHSSSTDATIAYYDITHNKIVVPNSEAKKFAQTDVTITIWQEETDQFEASGEKTIELTVKKYDNALNCSWGVWSQNLNFDQQIEVMFNANNDVTPIVLTQTAGNASGQVVASYNSEKDSIYAFWNIGSATWTVKQDENYKYKAPATKTVTVNVDKLDETCYVLNDPSEYEIGTIGTNAPLALSASGRQLTFEARQTLGSLSDLDIQYSTNGGEFQNLRSVDLTASWKEYGPYDIPEAATHIRFKTEVGATLLKHYRNIQITRRESFKIVDKEGAEISTLEMPMNVISAKEGVANSSSAKFYVDYNVCADEIKVASNHGHFTVSENAFSTVESSGRGVKEITVTYTCADYEDTHATITVYTPFDHKTLTVHGRTDKQSQEIVWANDFQEEPVTLSLGYITGSAASATSEMPVKYTVAEGEKNIIEIDDDGYYFTVIGEGYVHLTATQEGNKAWYPASSTKKIYATGKKIQVIQWIQDLTYSLQPDDNVELLAEVHIRNMQTGTHTKDDARTALIQYSCPADNKVIEILDNKTLHVLGYGTTTVTASVEGNAYYKEAAPVTLLVEVHEPSTGCPDPLMINKTDMIELFSMNIDWGFSDGVTPAIIGNELPIDLKAGKPDKLSFQHEGEKYIAPVIKTEHYKGYIKAQQHVAGDWIDVAGSRVEPTVSVWNEINDLPLNPNADAIRFVREANGMGYHHISNVRVTMQSYLSTDEPVVDLGTLQIGTVLEATLDIEYANVKGTLLATRETEEDIFTLGVSAIYPDCGSVGKYEWPIRFAPTTKGEWQNKVTITDELTGREVVFTVKANVIPGAMFIFETEGEWGDESKWNKEELPGADDYVIIAQDVTIPKDADVTVKTLAINEGVTVTVEGKLTIMESTPGLENHGNLHVGKEGYVNLDAITVGGLKVNNFTLDAALGNISNTGYSGQVTNAEKLIVTGDAYFQMSLDPSGSITYGWYDFVVPFEVDVLDGISIVGNTIPLKFNVNYAVMDNSEAKRAVNGKDWNKFRGTMLPGRVYTITLDDEHPEWNTVLFKKKDGVSVTGDRSYTTEYTAEGETKDRGWNGFGNGTLQHAELNVSDEQKIQIYDHHNFRFEPHDAKDYSIAVGTSFFMQFGGVQTVELLAAEGNDKFLAPARERRATEEFRLALTAEGEEHASDRLWVSASEEATGAYVIGHDLLKMGTPAEAKVAQMWANNAGNRLCDIEMPLNGDGARCELGLFAPKESSYTLSVEKAPEDVTLYLTYNDRPIWNLSMSPYVLDLTNGTTEGYGLQLYVRPASEVATGVDEVQGDNVPCTKVLMDGKMYIITPEGAIFDATGKKVK